MAPIGKHATPIIACSPEVQGTAICHNSGKCYVCDIAARHEVKVYLTAQSKAFGCTFEASPSQIDRIARDMSLYGFPLCLCKSYVPELINIEDVKCPCPEAAKDIADKGRCHCGIFRRVEQ
jgi:ferredoxin-thioredoxin reductase catalytic subunit